MKAYFAAALILPLTSACAIIPDTPRSNGDAARQGTAVAINAPVWAGDTILTPLSVVEDSRCPQDVRCVQAGKLVVSTRITATHWQQTVPLTLGEPYTVMNRSYVLSGASPGQVAGQAIQPGAYRLYVGGGQPGDGEGQWTDLTITGAAVGLPKRSIAVR